MIAMAPRAIWSILDKTPGLAAGIGSHRNFRVGATPSAPHRCDTARLDRFTSVNTVRRAHLEKHVGSGGGQGAYYENGLERRRGNKP